MIKIFKPEIVSKFPLVTGILFVFNTLSQTIKVWTNHSSKDQSLIGWISLTFALILFLIFYKVCCPKEKYAFWTTFIEVLTNIFLIISVLIFK